MTIKPTGKKEGARKEFSRADQIRVIKEVLDGTYTYLEACRAYKLQSNQIYAWLGKAVIEEWDEIMRWIRGGVVRAPTVAVIPGSAYPMIPLDDVTKFKLAIADHWLSEHGNELLSGQLPMLGPVKKSDIVHKGK